MEEIWLPLEESVNCYVSNLGNLLRKPYPGVSGRFISGPKLSQKGYKRVTLRGKQYFVHRLVGKYFVPNPNNKPFINHIDGNKLNNQASNLEWVTNYENRQHAVANKLNGAPKRKFDAQTEAHISFLHIACNYSQREIAEQYSTTQQHISKIIKRYKKSLFKYPVSRSGTSAL